MYVLLLLKCAQFLITHCSFAFGGIFQQHNVQADDIIFKDYLICVALPQCLQILFYLTSKFCIILPDDPPHPGSRLINSQRYANTDRTMPVLPIFYACNSAKSHRLIRATVRCARIVRTCLSSAATLALFVLMWQNRAAAFQV